MKISPETNLVHGVVLVGEGRGAMTSMTIPLHPGALPAPVADLNAMTGRLQTWSALERVWVLALLGRGTEAVEERHALLAGSTRRLFALLVLARVFQSRHRWEEAARVHEETVRQARTQSAKPLSVTDRYMPL